MPRFPDTFIVGAPKAGTTSLFGYLNRHPQVFMSAHKEPHYFAHDMVLGHRVETLNAYLALFAEAAGELRVGEASVSYLQSESATQAIAASVSDPRILIMLRNPVDLVVSLHAQLLGSAGEDRVDLAEALRLQAARRSGQMIPSTCKSPSYLQYERTATFSGDVARYLRIFGKDRVKVVIFDDFAADTPGECASVCEFLGIDPGAVGAPRQLNSRAGRVIPNLHLVRLMNRAPWLRSALRRAAPGRAITWLKLELGRRTQRQPSEPSMEVVRQLRGAFDHDVRELSELLQRDLHRLWLAPR